MTKVKLKVALWRGLNRKCPNCGQGQAFKSYLKIVDHCAICATPLSQYPCDDGPAYLTILLVGHLVVAPMFLFEPLWRGHTEIILPLAVGDISILSLIVLPFIKGLFLAILWINGVKRNRT